MRQGFRYSAEPRVTEHSRNVWPYPVSRERMAIWVELALGEEIGGWHLQKRLFKPIPKQVREVALSGGDLWDNA